MFLEFFFTLLISNGYEFKLILKGWHNFLQKKNAETVILSVLKIHGLTTQVSSSELDSRSIYILSSTSCRNTEKLPMHLSLLMTMNLGKHISWYVCLFTYALYRHYHQIIIICTSLQDMGMGICFARRLWPTIPTTLARRVGLTIYTLRAFCINWYSIQYLGNLYNT